MHMQSKQMLSLKKKDSPSRTYPSHAPNGVNGLDTDQI